MYDRCPFVFKHDLTLRTKIANGNVATNGIQALGLMVGTPIGTVCRLWIPQVGTAHGRGTRGEGPEQPVLAHDQLLATIM